jgi:hypothetical protein
MLEPAEVESLLSKLCIELGFCLPPEHENHLIENPPSTVEEFADAVFRFEGLNPQYAERHLYRQVRDKIAEAFEKHNQEHFFDSLKNDRF